jgi:PST family polysaccharide transporter
MNTVAEQPAIQPARLRSNVAALSILQVMNYAVPLATVPYLVRVLGPAHFGLLAFAQALIVYFDLLTDYGSLLSATRAVAVHRHDSEALSHIFWRTAAARLALAFGCALALSALVLAAPPLRAAATLYAAAFLTVIGTAIFPVWFFQGIEQMKYVTAAHSSARVLTIPALFLLVRHPDHYVRAAAVQGAVPVLAGILVAPVLWRKLRHGFHRPAVSEIAGVLREGWSAFVANSALVFNATATITVLGLVAGAAEVGYYSAADKVIRALSSLLNPVTQALYPHLNSLKTRSPHLTARLMRRSYVWIGLPALAVSVATFAVAGPAGLALWGHGFLRSAAVLRCLSPLPFLLALVNLIGVQTLLVLGLDSLVSRTVFAAALFNVALTAWLSASYGALGAAAANVAGAVLLVCGLAGSARRAVRS